MGKKKLIDRYKNLILEEERILEEKENIRNEFIISAKFKVGDSVIWSKSNWNGKPTGEKINGIVRVIFPCEKYSDKLEISYRVGKIKKDGTIHANQDIYYSLIPENELQIIKGII
jgi:hypothetical protein